eukprot:Gb_27897 [translate_table: standard]
MPRGRDCSLHSMYMKILKLFPTESQEQAKWYKANGDGDGHNFVSFAGEGSNYTLTTSTGHVSSYTRQISLGNRQYRRDSQLGLQEVVHEFLMRFLKQQALHASGLTVLAAAELNRIVIFLLFAAVLGFQQERAVGLRNLGHQSITGMPGRLYAENVSSNEVLVATLGKNKGPAHPDFDLNYTSMKRRVPNGSDPIHNRRAGKSREPPECTVIKIEDLRHARSSRVIRS